jgi:hypothetical protein
MGTRVNTDWSYLGLQVVKLENEFLCLDVLPQLGAKVWNIIHKPSNRNMLWHNPHVAPQLQPFGAHFDDVWSGGWDELIPNDVPTEVLFGDVLPDHGEVWSQPTEWEIVETEADGAAVRFVNYGRVYSTRFEKTIVLRANKPFFQVQYRYINLGVTPIDFLWNIHPVLNSSTTTRLDLPAERAITDEWSSQLCDGGTEFEWPYLTTRNKHKIDLRVMPPKGALADIHIYMPDIKEGWYAATDTEAKIGFGIAFPKDVFPNLWLFRATGGWRGLYTQIVEISNGLSTQLAIARETRDCGHLEAGAEIQAEIVAVVYTGCKSVKRIEVDGHVIAE